MTFQTLYCIILAKIFFLENQKRKKGEKTMKKQFESVEIFITLFAQEDVIATSGGVKEDSGENDGEWDG